MAKKSKNQIGGKPILNVQNKAGQNFPTTDPTFKPREPQAQDIKFNPGISGKVERGGELLSRKENTQLNEGNITNQATRNVANKESSYKELIRQKVLADRAIQAQNDLDVQNEAVANKDPVLNEQKKGAIENVGNLTAEQLQLDVVKDNIFDKAKVAGSTALGLGTTAIGASTPAGVATAGTIGGALGVSAGAVAGATIAGAGIIAGVGAYSFTERQDKNTANNAFNDGKMIMNDVVKRINSGAIPPEDYGEAVETFNQGMAMVLSANRNLYEQTSTDLNKFLSGAGDSATSSNSYVENILPGQIASMKNAIATPNANNINAQEQLTTP